MTIYSELLKRGYTDEEIRGAVEELDTRTFTLSVYDTPDGWPIVGVQYMCDFRYEEEAGLGELTRSIEGKTNQVEKIKATPEGGFIFLTNAYLEEGYEVMCGRQYWSESLGYAQGAKSLRTYQMTVQEMKQWAKDNNLSLKGKTKRDDIEPLVRRKSIELSEKKTPNKWPGYFHHGNVLYLRANGIVQETLKLIYMAAGEDAVGVSGKGSSNPFGRGFGFYDKRDIGPKLQAAIEEENQFYINAMEELAPVRDDLEKQGYKFLFLGKPALMKGETKYWMNGHLMDITYGQQPYGWYTLEELKDLKFVEDSRRRALRKKLIFTAKGEYRKDSIYTEDGKWYDYVSMAKRDGLPDDPAYHEHD